MVDRWASVTIAGLGVDWCVFRVGVLCFLCCFTISVASRWWRGLHRLGWFGLVLGPPATG